MQQDKSPAELLGYYFIIFQDNFRGYVKCWLDGSENYSYFKEEDFISMFNKVNADFDLIYQAKSCLTTTGIYIWSINDKKITRLKHSTDIPSLTENIKNMNPLNLEKKNRVRKISIFENILKRDK